MTIKNLKPTTPGQRGTVLVDKSMLWKGNSLKSLVVKYNSTGGRNNQGRITSRHMGGGAKRKYRIIDFKRNKFDVEGEVIGWNVIRFICKKKDAKRMKFSSLTKDALNESFKEIMPTLNWGAAIAGETRHYIDWYYGINLSRGLMNAISNTGTFRILSFGMVQVPTLKILVNRER